MDLIREDTIGGFNSFLSEQKAAEGTATLTLVQFDSGDPYEVVHRVKPIQEVPGLDHHTFVPRGMTPLLDALGRAINDLDAWQVGLKSEALPEHIIVAVVTDGMENASCEFRRADISRLIEKRTAAGWHFIFLSADLSAVQEAREIGYATARTLKFEGGVGARRAFEASSRNISSMRNGLVHCLDFSESDLAEQKELRKQKHHPADPRKNSRRGRKTRS
jgi:hypothetical protein